jgi:hypothetical protein
MILQLQFYGDTASKTRGLEVEGAKMCRFRENVASAEHEHGLKGSLQRDPSVDQDVKEKRKGRRRSLCQNPNVIQCHSF